jgi:hypothetical protein
MVQLNLTEQQVASLKGALETFLSDLRMEIADTDSQPYRERLKQEEATLKHVVEQLGAVALPQ